MKIAFVNDGIYEYASGASNALGGAERDQWLLARALAAAGWSAAFGVRGPLKVGERQVFDGVECVGLGSGQTLMEWRKFLSSERPDWLFWECANHLWGPLVEIAKLTGVRTIFHVAFDRDVLPRQALFRRRHWWPLYAWGLLRTDRIFVQHGGQLVRLPLRLQSKASILPKVCLPGANPATMFINPHSKREKYVAWVATLRQHKRPDILIEIARMARDIRFVVCGGISTFMTPPGYGERIVNQLRRLPNVEYLGQVPPATAHQIIAGAAVLLSTSDEEGFPNTFTQAWSSGTPVVSLKIDPDRIIERVGLGSVSGNIESAVADVTALLNSTKRRDEISIRACRFVADNNSAAAVVKLFERALQPTSR